MGLLKAIFGNYSEKEIKRIMPLVDKVLSLEEEYLEEGKIGYAAILNLHNVRYRIVGQLEKEELIKIIEKLNF